MAAMYHITPAVNIAAILADGLKPMIGPRCHTFLNSCQDYPGKCHLCNGCDERSPAIYLFRTEEDVETALLNWAAESFPDDMPLAILKVEMPDEMVPPVKEHDPFPWEAHIEKPIPAAFVSFVRNV